MASASVLLIEDEQFTRLALAGALAPLGIEVVASGATAAVALEAQHKHSIDVAVLDLDLGPGPTGVDIARALRTHNRTIGIVFLTSYSDPRLAGIDRNLIPVGSRFLTKSRLGNLDELRLAILQAKQQPLRSSPVRQSPTDVTLTQHQIDIARAVAAGQSNAQIAQQRGITEKAVENTLSRIYEVLQIQRTAGANPRIQLSRALASMAGKQPPTDRS